MARAKTQFKTAPVWNNPESEAAHVNAVAVPYFEPVSRDKHREKSEIKPTFGPASGETWKCDSDVQGWKDAFVGNPYSPVKSEGFRLRANNGKIHDGFIEIGCFKGPVGGNGVHFGNAMYWPVATGAGNKDGLKGVSFRLHSQTHSSGGTNSEGTNAFRHNTWLRAVGFTMHPVRLKDGGQYASNEIIWGSGEICTAGDQATGGGKFVTITFDNAFFAEAKRWRDQDCLPVITNAIFQLWTGYRGGIDTGSTDSTLTIYDLKMHYTFGPESANANKCLLLPAWTYQANAHFHYGNHVRMGFED
jgi:hypothetical protein